MIEYKTTHARWFDVLRKSGFAPAPKPPNGDDWVLIGSSMNDDYMFWFWEREIDNHE